MIATLEFMWSETAWWKEPTCLSKSG